MELQTDVGASAPANEAALTADTAITSETETAATPTIDSDLMAVWEKHNPKRDPFGRFEARDTAAQAETEEKPQEAATEEISAGQPEEKADETTDQSSIAAPNSWPAEGKSIWANVPPAAQAIIAKREAEAHQAITRAGEQLKAAEQRVAAYQPLDQLFDAYKDDFARKGVAPAQGIQMLLNAQRALDANPLGAMVQIGLSYGIDLRPVLQGQTQAQAEGGAPPELNPEVLALRNEIAAIKSHLTEQQLREHNAQQAQVQAQEAALAKEIAEFAKDRPHFEAVRSIMAGLMQTGAAANLAEAYDKSVYAIPEIRERILSDQRKAEEQKRQAEQVKKAADAKKSATVNVKSTTAAGSSPKTVDDTLREVARKLYA